MTVEPLTHREFARAIQRLGPFEKHPRLAVAVSGGADSLALALFAAAWVRKRGGGLTALTVDHGLRPEAAAEARRVGRWLRARGVEHRIIAWRGTKPAANIQAAARAARYGLLSGWCARHGVLHLLLAHHADDQAETYLLRLARGSGVDGLAAMAPVHELPSVRVLRPLLDVPRARLEAALRRARQDWVDDPTNRDRDHARVRMRQLLPSLSAEGLSGPRLARTASRLARARATLEMAVADMLAETVMLHPAGFCLLDREKLLAAPPEIALRATARILRTVSGAAYPPRLENLERLLGELSRPGAQGRTLAGCRVLSWRESLLVCREAGAVAGKVPLAGGRAVWDDRFEVEARVGKDVFVGPVNFGARDQALKERLSTFPAAVRPSLPALWGRKGLVAVPPAGYLRETGRKKPPIRCKFKPEESLMGAPFAVV
ncbi:MAG: tRNA lysidine(34) synthetase TilS [Alphaproteobacteria bacterium]